MSRYASVDCPICGKPLENGEEIVVCPDCGAPYHRPCYLKEGMCIYPELHAAGKSWEAPKKAASEQESAKLRCPACGTVNPPYGLFCQSCGVRLNEEADPSVPPPFGQNYGFYGAPGQNQSQQHNPSSGSSQPENGVPPFGGMPFGFGFGFPGTGTSPLGGVAPDEEIDGIPAKDYAAFIGRNAQYFLPRFKEISKNKTHILNWSGFFFQGGYFLYRKMYLPAVIIFLFDLLLSVPNLLLTYYNLSAGGTLAASSNLSTLSVVSVVCSFLTLGIRFFCGFMANPLYKKHCERKIVQVKSHTSSEEEYQAALTRKGSVAVRLITGLLIAYATLNLVAMYVLILTGGF